MGGVQGVMAPVADRGAELTSAWLWLPLGLAAAAAASLVFLAYAAAGFSAGLLAALMGLLLCAAVVLLLSYRRAVASLHLAVQAARDGRLCPLPLPGWPRRLVGHLADEYDALASEMGSLFSGMERAQLAIIAERNGHEAILQSLPGALLTVDQHHRITGSNLQAEVLFGRSAAALAGSDIISLMHADEAGQVLLCGAFDHSEPVRNGLLTIAVGEEQRHVSLNLTFFKRRQDATTFCAAIILQDVTEYRRLEEITNQTEKLVAMGQLAGGVAHELNTPLGTIMGYAQLLNEGRASEQRRAEYARVIHDESKRCSRIIDNLLTYARQPACQGLQANTATVIAEACEAVANCQGRRLQVAIRSDEVQALVVQGSAGQLEIVLVNLVVNAVQAASGVAVPLVQVSCTREGAFAVVSVVDNGPGVPAHVRRRVFEPFFTTKDAGHGTGLGLALSHSIATRMGGTLQCDAAPAAGARFVLTLPLAH